jgi:hypothetical protein
MALSSGDKAAVEAALSQLLDQEESEFIQHSMLA